MIYDAVWDFVHSFFNLAYILLLFNVLRTMPRPKFGTELMYKKMKDFSYAGNIYPSNLIVLYSRQDVDSNWFLFATRCLRASTSDSGLWKLNH